MYKGKWRRSAYPVGLACHVERTTFELGERLEEERDELLDDWRCVFRSPHFNAEVGVRETYTDTVRGNHFNVKHEESRGTSERDARLIEEEYIRITIPRVRIERRAVPVKTNLAWAKFHEKSGRTGAPRSTVNPHEHRIGVGRTAALEEVEEHVLSALCGIEIPCIAP